MRPHSALRRHLESWGSDWDLAYLLLPVPSTLAARSWHGAPCHLMQTQMRFADIHPFADLSSVPLFLSEMLQAALIVEALSVPSSSFLPAPACCVGASPTWEHCLRKDHLLLSLMASCYIEIPLRKIDHSPLICSAVFFWIMIVYNSPTISCKQTSAAVPSPGTAHEESMGKGCAGLHASVRTAHAALVQNQVLSDLPKLGQACLTGLCLNAVCWIFIMQPVVQGNL